MLNREIAHKFNTGWELDTVKGVEKSGELKSLISVQVRIPAT
jgi:hypothetical protein